MKYTISALSLFSLASSIALADSITMIDGKQYPDCEFIYETAKDVTVSIPVTKSIREDVTLPKDKIAKHVKSTPDEIEFKKLTKRYSGELPKADRADAIAALDAYATKYPKSPYLKQIEELKAPLELKSSEAADQEAAAESADQEGKDPSRFVYDANANKLYSRFAASIQAMQPIIAMQHFDRLRQSYAASKAYAKAYPVASKVAKRVQADLTVKVKALEDALLARRKAAAALPADRRSAANQAIADTLTQQREALVAIKAPLQEKRLRWFTPPIDNIAAHKELLNLSNTELTMLGRDPDKNMGAATPLFVTVWEALDAGKVNESRTSYQQLRSTRVPPEFLEDIQKKLEEVVKVDIAQKEAAREAAAKQKEEELAAKVKERDEEQKKRRFEAEKERLRRAEAAEAKRAGAKGAKAPTK